MEKLIKEFHQLYAKYKRPQYLEIAGNLGRTKPDDFEEIWERQVNAGAAKQGIPLPYPNRAC